MISEKEREYRIWNWEEEYKKLEMMYDSQRTKSDELKATLRDISSPVTDLRARIDATQIRAE